MVRPAEDLDLLQIETNNEKKEIVRIKLFENFQKFINICNIVNMTFVCALDPGIEEGANKRGGWLKKEEEKGCNKRGKVKCNTPNFVYKGAHIFNLFLLLVANNMVVEEGNTLQN